MESVVGTVDMPQARMAASAKWDRMASASPLCGTVPPFPPIVYIEPTNLCNCNCIICPRQNMTREKGYMAWSLFHRIVDQLAEAGSTEARLFNFGEPLLHPDFPEMIRYCKTSGVAVNFQTNGLLLTESIIRKLLAAGVTYFGISANGLSAREYEQIRPGFGFSAFKENLALLRRIAGETDLAIVIHINAQISRENRPALKLEIERYALEWSGIADSVSISGLSRFDGTSFVENGTCRESRTRHGTRRNDSDVACQEPFDRLVIKWDGRVTPCCVDFDALEVVGDARTQSLRDIWLSRNMNALRAAVDSRMYNRIPLCRTCPKFYSKEFSLTFSKRTPGPGT